MAEAAAPWAASRLTGAARGRPGSVADAARRKALPASARDAANSQIWHTPSPPSSPAVDTVGFARTGKEPGAERQFPGPIAGDRQKRYVTPDDRSQGSAVVRLDAAAGIPPIGGPRLIPRVVTSNCAKIFFASKKRPQ